MSEISTKDQVRLQMNQTLCNMFERYSKSPSAISPELEQGPGDIIRYWIPRLIAYGWFEDEFEDFEKMQGIIEEFQKKRL